MKLYWVAVPAWVVIGSLTPMKAQTAAPDPAMLIRQSITNYEQNWREASDWEYREIDVTHQDGTTTTEVNSIAPLYGTPYGVMIEKDGERLSGALQSKEERKFHKAERERQRETPEERQVRIDKYDNERTFVRDIPNAYTFRLLGEDAVEGRPAWIVELTPKPGFVPTQPHASMLSHIQGKLWIDKEDIDWAKAEADVIDTISIGWILARIGPGAHITLTQTRVAPGFWMPKQIVVNGSARVLLVHNRPINEELSYSGFKRATDSSQAPNSAKGGPAPVNTPSQTATQSFQ